MRRASSWAGSRAKWKNQNLVSRSCSCTLMACCVRLKVPKFPLMQSESAGRARDNWTSETRRLLDYFRKGTAHLMAWAQECDASWEPETGDPRRGRSTLADNPASKIIFPP